MSKKLYHSVLANLLSEDIETARNSLTSYITRKSAIIERNLRENGNNPVYVADVEDDKVHITKCESIEVADLFIEMLDKDSTPGEQFQLEVHNTLPQNIMPVVKSANALTSEDLDNSNDPIADSEHATVEVSKEEWEENVVEECAEEIVEDTLVITVCDSIASKKVSRILRAHSEDVTIETQEDADIFTARFDDVEELEKIAERIDDIDGVDDIFITSEAEPVSDIEGSPESDPESLEDELVALGGKFMTLNGKVDDIDDERIRDLDEAFELETVSKPELNGSKGIGNDKSKIRINNKSPLIQNNRTEAEPVEIISQDHSGYSREAAPAYGTLPKARNQKEKAFSDYKNVSKEGDSKARLNSQKGFGKGNEKSPIVSTKPYKK